MICHQSWSLCCGRFSIATINFLSWWMERSLIFQFTNRLTMTLCNRSFTHLLCSVGDRGCYVVISVTSCRICALCAVKVQWRTNYIFSGHIEQLTSCRQSLAAACCYSPCAFISSMLLSKRRSCSTTSFETPGAAIFVRTCCLCFTTILRYQSYTDFHLATARIVAK